MTDSLSAELEYSQKLAGPLLDSLRCALERARAFTGAARAARAGTAAGLFSPDDAAAAARAADGALDTARLACRVFFSLNSPGLTEVFEDALPGGWSRCSPRSPWRTRTRARSSSSSSESQQQQQQFPDAAAAQAAVAAAVAAASGPGAVSLPPRSGNDVPQRGRRPPRLGLRRDQPVRRGQRGGVRAVPAALRDRGLGAAGEGFELEFLSLPRPLLPPLPTRGATPWRSRRCAS